MTSLEEVFLKIGRQEMEDDEVLKDLERGYLRVKKANLTSLKSIFLYHYLRIFRKLKLIYVFVSKTELFCKVIY